MKVVSKAQALPITEPSIGDEESTAVAAVLESGWLTQGRKVAEFEAAVATYLGVPEAVATSSCTTALHLSLTLLGVGPGDEVIIPALSFIATANAVTHAGGIPVFADVAAGSLNIDPGAIEQVMTPRTKVIMPVHQLGMIAEVESIKSIADKHGVAILEDAACAIGATDHKGRHAPIDTVACFSFHPRKMITTGEGGMIATRDSAIADHARVLRSHGMSKSDLDRHAHGGLDTEEYLEPGFNFRLSDIHAAIGVEQMKKLDGILNDRSRIAARYNDAFSDVRGLGIPIVPAGFRQSYQSYVVLVTPSSKRTRREVREFLLERGIQTRNGVMAIHRTEAMRRYQTAPLPETDYMADASIVIPLFPDMDEEQIEHVIVSTVDAVEAG